MARVRPAVPSSFSPDGRTKGGHATPRPVGTVCDLLKAFERVGILTNAEHQRGGLGIGSGAALLPLFEGSQVNAELSRKHGARATQFLAHTGRTHKIRPSCSLAAHRSVMFFLRGTQIRT